MRKKNTSQGFQQGGRKDLKKKDNDIQQKFHVGG